LKTPITKKKAGGVAQGVDPKFKPQYSKKERKKETYFRLDGKGRKDETELHQDLRKRRLFPSDK
jgi:hypothetical protein